MIFTLGNLIATFENILDKEYLLRRSIQSPFVQENWDLAQELRESSRTCAFFSTKILNSVDDTLQNCFTNNQQDVKICQLAMCLISNLDKFWWYLVFWAALQIASYIPFMHAWKRKIFAPNNILLPIALVLMAAYELAIIFGLFMTSIFHWFSSGSNWIFECFFPENLLKFWPAQFDKITNVSQKASLLIIQQNILCV